MRQHLQSRQRQAPSPNVVPKLQNSQPQLGPQQGVSPAEMQKQALLSQLKDVHTPQPQAFWPPAPGWWALLFVLIVISGYLSQMFKRYRQANRYRREAKKEFSRLCQQSSRMKDGEYLQAHLSLLKRAALSAYPQHRQSIAPMLGRQQLQFFERSCSKKKLHAQANWGDAHYRAQHSKDQPALNRTALEYFCQNWIEHHNKQFPEFPPLEPGQQGPGFQNTHVANAKAGDAKLSQPIETSAVLASSANKEVKHA